MASEQAPARPGFNPLVVIPVFDHEHAIATMVEGVLAADVPCLLVDDGSGAACARELDRLAALHAPRVGLLRLPVNQGKGGAVLAGFRQAGGEGYSHVLQIDADGQHDPADIPRFLARARAHPDDVVCGVPRYDASVPKGRLYGRYLTHVWVWINTLSFAIRDSMCGFRVYPLPPVLRLMDEETIGLRMDFDVEEGEVVVLLGANGAGKTTTLKAVTGLQPIGDGDVKYLGRSLKGQGAWDLAKQGLVMIPEGRGTFTRMTITENLQMGAYTRDDKAAILEDIDKVFSIFPRLKERRDQLAGTMSGGEQQMLAMGRALMARPKVLLLDEPSMGLSPIMVDKIFEVVNDIHKQGVTMLLVEQNASRALAVADRGYVMESGLITMTGAGRQLLEDPKVRAAYLGE